jgi:hypothetical protein
MKTEALDKTPPHGMKGAVGPSNALSPKPFLVGASAVLLVAMFAALVMFVIDWQRRRRLRKAAVSLLLVDPTAWARLRESISQIRVPEIDSVDFAAGGTGHSYSLATGEPSDAAGISHLSEGDRLWNHFSSEVSLCLRRGLELRTGLPLAESTTEEVVALLSKRQLQLEFLSDTELREILKRLDRIRFGGFKITKSEGENILKDLVGWCDRLENVSSVGSSSSSNTVTNDKGELRVFD